MQSKIFATMEEAFGAWQYVSRNIENASSIKHKVNTLPLAEWNGLIGYELIVYSENYNVKKLLDEYELNLY